MMQHRVLTAASVNWSVQVHRLQQQSPCIGNRQTNINQQLSLGHAILKVHTTWYYSTVDEAQYVSHKVMNHNCKTIWNIFNCRRETLIHCRCIETQWLCRKIQIYCVINTSTQTIKIRNQPLHDGSKHQSTSSICHLVAAEPFRSFRYAEHKQIIRYI